MMSILMVLTAALAAPVQEQPAWQREAGTASADTVALFASLPVRATRPGTWRLPVGALREGELAPLLAVCALDPREPSHRREACAEGLVRQHIRGEVPGWFDDWWERGLKDASDDAVQGILREAGARVDIDTLAPWARTWLDSEDPADRWALAFALRTHGGDGRALPWLRGLLGDSDPDVLVQALKVAGRHGLGSLEASVRPHLTHPDPRVEAEALRALFRMGAEDAARLAAQRRDHPSAEVVRVASWVLED